MGFNPRYKSVGRMLGRGGGEGGASKLLEFWLETSNFQIFGLRPF